MFHIGLVKLLIFLLFYILNPPPTPQKLIIFLIKLVLKQKSTYLSNLEWFLMFHTSLKTKPPWHSTGQSNDDLLCNHFFLLYFYFFLLFFDFCILSEGHPSQCFSSMVVSQGPPHRALVLSVLLLTLIWTPQPALAPARAHAHFMPPHPYPEWASHLSLWKGRGKTKYDGSGGGGF